MRIIVGLVLACALAICSSCGGGGGAGSTITGNVLEIETLNPPSPAVTVQSSSGTTTTALADGSFTVSAPLGSTTVTVVSAGADGAFTFHFPATTMASTNIGDLYIGPQKVTLTGKVLKAADQTAVPGALVSFAGQSGTTDSTGTYTMAEVAYSSTNNAGFYSLTGTVQATGYVNATFSTAPNVPDANNVITLPSILLSPTSDPNPPGDPYNLWGVISPAAKAAGTIVTLKLHGTPIRQYTVTDTQQYYFWVTPGTYVLSFKNGTLTATDQSVTISATDDVERRDATLH